MQDKEKRGPKERPLNTLGNQQKMTRLVKELKDRIDKLQTEAAVDDAFMAKALRKLVHPCFALLKEKWESEWLAGQQPSKEFTEERLEKILLSKLVALTPDNSWTTIRNIGEVAELPSVKTLTRIKEKVNQTLKDQLKLKSDSDLVSCSIGVEEGIKFILRLHLSAFGEKSLPADVTFKFSFDGRPIEGRHEVVVGLVPINTQFPEQSGYSSFPFEILQGTEKQAKENIKKIARALVDIEKKGINWLNDNLFKYDGSFNIKIVVCSDLVAIWRATNLRWKRGDDCQFCPKCLRTCLQIGNVQKVAEDERRDLLPELNLPAKDYIYCSLHAGMRITERIIEAVAMPLKTSERKKFAKEARLHDIKIDLTSSKKIQVSVQGNTVKDILCDPTAINNEDHTLIYQRLIELPLDVNPATEEIKFLVDWYMVSNRTNDTVSATRRKENITMLLNSWAAVYLIISYDKDVTDMYTIALNAALTSMQQIFLKIFVDFMTPYLHLLFCHTEEIIETHKSIGKFSQQGFEQANSLHRSIEVRASNHGGGRGNRSVSEQVMNHVWGRLYLIEKLQKYLVLNKIHHRVTKYKKTANEESESGSDEEREEPLEVSKKRKRRPNAVTKANKRRRLSNKELAIEVFDEEKSDFEEGSEVGSEATNNVNNNNDNNNKNNNNNDNNNEDN